MLKCFYCEKCKLSYEITTNLESPSCLTCGHSMQLIKNPYPSNEDNGLIVEDEPLMIEGYTNAMQLIKNPYPNEDEDEPSIEDDTNALEHVSDELEEETEEEVPEAELVDRDGLDGFEELDQMRRLNRANNILDDFPNRNLLRERSGFVPSINSSIGAVNATDSSSGYITAGLEDISSIKPSDLTVAEKHVEIPSKLNNKDFVNKLFAFLREGKVWRSSTAICEKLDVDPEELDEYLRKRHDIACKSNKDGDSFYYAEVERLSDKDKVIDEQTKRAVVEARESMRNVRSRSLVSEEDRYALAVLNNIYMNFKGILDKYGIKLYDKEEEIFNHLMNAKKKMFIGITLLADAIKADISKL